MIALPPIATTIRIAPSPRAAAYEPRIASQIARAGRSSGLAHECGRTVRKWIESPGSSS